MKVVRLFISIVFMTILISGCNDEEIAIDDTTTLSNNLENFESFQEDAFNFSSDDEGFNFEDCELEDDNSILMVGSSTEFGISSTLIRVNSNFDIDFSREFSPSEKSLFRPMDLIKTNDQNFLYCSRLFEASSNKVDVRKFDPSGNLIWNTIVGNPSVEERGVAITEISEDNIMVLADDLEFLFTDSCFSLITLDHDGNMMSNFKISDTDINRMERILYSPVDETVIVLGEYGFSGIGAFQTSLKVSKYSLSGELISSKIIVEEVDIFPSSNDMKLLPDGNILIYTSSNNRSNPNNPTPNIFKVDFELNDIWAFNYDDIRVNIVNEIQETTDGNLLILSKTSTINGEEFDIVLTSVNENFELNWIKSYGTSSSDQGVRLLVDSLGDITIVGNSNYNTGSESIFDYFILKLDSEGNPK